jgi:hypothetical protein
MSLEERKCPHCEKRLRSNNTRGICKTCWDDGKRPAANPADDSVLSRMGFGGGAGVDEAPPATKRPRPRKARVPKAQLPPAPPWRDQFSALARALGLDPDAMLEAHCREWVEATKQRALPESFAPKQLTAGDGELARRAPAQMSEA